MGSDNLFKKRKAKLAADLKRRQAKKSPYDTVLIVCEGGKTEPNYFCELRDYYRINTANVEISGDCGSSPISVLEKARQLYRESQRKGIPFDRVYCVFDKDTHSSYEQTLEMIQSSKPTGTFFAITSVPCFEFWLLLHFTYSTQPFYGTTGAKSAGDEVVAELKRYISDYAKGVHGHFHALVDDLARAIEYSKRVLLEAQKNETDNPSTSVHELVEYLQGLASRNV